MKGFKSLTQRYVRISAAHPFALLLAFTVLTVVSGFLMTKLNINMDLKKLLPNDIPSVRALDESQARRGSSDLYTIAVESPSAYANAAFIDDLAAHIDAEWDHVVWTQTGEDPTFFRDHAMLYMPEERLRNFDRDLRDSLDCEHARVNPTYVVLRDIDCASLETDWSMDAWIGDDMDRELGLPEGFFGELDLTAQSSSSESDDDHPEGLGDDDDEADDDWAAFGDDDDDWAAFRDDDDEDQNPDGDRNGDDDSSQLTDAEGDPDVPLTQAVDIERSPDQFAATEALPEELSHYIISPDGQIAVMYVQMDRPSTDIDFASSASQRGERLIVELGPENYHPQMRARVVGAFRSLNEATEALSDSTKALFASLVLVILIMVGFFRAVRGLVVVLVPLLMGVTWTMGLAKITIGELNLFSLFVGSVLVGMGIDYGIHVYGRALEEFRAGKPWEQALSVALYHTGGALLASAVTTIGALLTLLVSHFQGFIEFGIIASFGVFLCMTTAFFVTPAMVMAFERLAPLKGGGAHLDENYQRFEELLLETVKAGRVSTAERQQMLELLDSISGQEDERQKYLRRAFKTARKHAGEHTGLVDWLESVTGTLRPDGLGLKGRMVLVAKLCVVASLGMLLISAFMPWVVQGNVQTSPLGGTHLDSTMLWTLIPTALGGLFFLRAGKITRSRSMVAMLMAILGFALWQVELLDIWQLEMVGLPAGTSGLGLWMLLGANGALLFGGLTGAVSLPDEERPRWAWAASAVLLALIIAEALLAPSTAFEYDFRNLRGVSSRAGISYGRAIGRGRNTTPSIILGNSQEQMREVHDELTRRMNEDENVMLKGFLTIETYVPRDQEARMQLINTIHERVNRRWVRHLTGEARDFVEVVQRLSDVEPFTVEDVPTWAIRTLTETDGSVGRIGLLFRRVQEWDVRQVQIFQSRFATIEVPSGVVHLADGTFISADVIRTVQEDGVRMAKWVVIVLLVVLLIALRSIRGTLICMLTMGAAFAISAALMVVTNTKVGMYNMIVLPAVLGVSIDGAIHLYHRHIETGGRKLASVMRTTGFAVAAASLTTAGGFAGLLMQRHMGIRSIGELALIGILSALLAVFVLMPGLLALIGPRKAAVGPESSEAAVSPEVEPVGNGESRDEEDESGGRDDDVESEAEGQGDDGETEGESEQDGE